MGERVSSIQEAATEMLRAGSWLFQAGGRSDIQEPGHGADRFQQARIEWAKVENRVLDLFGSGPQEADNTRLARELRNAREELETARLEQTKWLREHNKRKEECKLLTRELEQQRAGSDHFEAEWQESQRLLEQARGERDQAREAFEAADWELEVTGGELDRLRTRIDQLEGLLLSIQKKAEDGPDNWGANECRLVAERIGGLIGDRE